LVSSTDPMRTRIINACYELLAEDGVDPTMGEVAKRTGISRQAVYLHFTSRTDLLLATVDHLNAEAGMPAQLERLAAAESSRQALEIAVDIAVWQVYQLGPAVIAVHRLVQSDHELESRWRDRPGRMTQFTSVVTALRRDGLLRKDLSIREAVALLNAMTLPEALMSLRNARFTRRRLTQLLTHSISQTLCGQPTGTDASPDVGDRDTDVGITPVH